ncbi:uracil-DNA glycosylase [Mycobacterium triplex]
MAEYGRNADPEVLAAKHLRIRELHVAPLNELADTIADVRGLPRSYIPYVDPDCGGVHARALVMLDNPSTNAEAGTGSGLLSLDNNDRTARNLRQAFQRHDIAWKDVVPWNAVPFPVAGKNGGPTAAERQQGAPWIKEFVSRCPNLEIVLLLGRAAEDGWKRAGVATAFTLVPGPVPHCSPRGLTTANARQRFDDAIAYLANVLKKARKANQHFSGGLASAPEGEVHPRPGPAGALNSEGVLPAKATVVPGSRH